jgi:hypothetical protein
MTKLPNLSKLPTTTKKQYNTGVQDDIILESQNKTIQIGFHTEQFMDTVLAEFTTDDGDVIVSLLQRMAGHMALVGVRTGGVLQMSVPVSDSIGPARVEYGNKTGRCYTSIGKESTRMFLRSANNRGLKEVLVVDDYMIGRFDNRDMCMYHIH